MIFLYVVKVFIASIICVIYLIVSKLFYKYRNYFNMIYIFMENK